MPIIKLPRMQEVWISLQLRYTLLVSNSLLFGWEDQFLRFIQALHTNLLLVLPLLSPLPLLLSLSVVLMLLVCFSISFPPFPPFLLPPSSTGTSTWILLSPSLPLTPIIPSSPLSPLSPPCPSLSFFLLCVPFPPFPFPSAISFFLLTPSLFLPFLSFPLPLSSSFHPPLII